MTKEDIIRMAREAGVKTSLFVLDGKDSGYFCLFERFAAIVAAAEREACASLCKGLAAWHGELITAAYETAADAIRARNLENLNKQAEANGEDL